jgi:hypothetical protein
MPGTPSVGFGHGDENAYPSRPLLGFCATERYRQSGDHDGDELAAQHGI